MAKNHLFFNFYVTSDSAEILKFTLNVDHGMGFEEIKQIWVICLIYNPQISKTGVKMSKQSKSLIFNTFQHYRKDFLHKNRVQMPEFDRFLLFLHMVRGDTITNSDIQGVKLHKITKNTINFAFFVCKTMFHIP